jgi:hypothetical protein
VHPPYDPAALDDPALALDKLRFAYNREGYSVSILAFRNERAQKDDANAKFARAHAWLDFGPEGQSLTLSKLRSLKRRALELWWGRGWDLSTVALAVVYLEQLINKCLVNKANRRLAMAVCLLLAFKMNEERDCVATASETPTSSAAAPSAKEVTAALEDFYSVTRRAVIAAEFPVYVHLRFGLDVPSWYAMPHLSRLLSLKGTTLSEYYGSQASALDADASLPKAEG